MTYNLLFKNLDELKIKGLGKANVSKLNKLHVCMIFFIFFPEPMRTEATAKI